ncbi:HET domain-containing protein [Podospora aff. communis PSN243]|uniref:HET domain-containing protein n=1 Tax=Podospora aff. communis PSN243 TaxID=3040156 RepID=A0AAV9GKG2_9PEZI|nr:HET domain-containing protein [Podospora aff. communis PSN243]
MRLINTTTLEMVEKFSDIPPYAILSHTWGSEEVTLKDYQLLRDSGAPIREQLKAGYVKIWRLCERAVEDGLQFAWIDTCCIDKTSSAELSEAINSMFKWYKDSAVCYAYLADVEPLSTIPAYELESDGWSEGRRRQLSASRWFTRGWTLQELIAPVNVEFLAQDWSEMGTKRSLIGALSKITGIRRRILESSNHVYGASAAERMSWAAERTTTREEDAAYCLFGIFGVNLPLLYGEGWRAFSRLQHEIFRTTEDYTLFAWSWCQDGPQSRESLRTGSVLALRPAAFSTLQLRIPAYIGNVLHLVEGPAAPTPEDCEKSFVQFASPNLRPVPWLEPHPLLKRLAKRQEDLSSTPRLTSRGLLVTMLACEVREDLLFADGEVSVIAWPFADILTQKQGSYASKLERHHAGIVLRIRRINQYSSQKHKLASVLRYAAGTGEPVSARRINGHALTHISPKDVPEFMPITMFLEMGDNLGPPSANLSLPGTRFKSVVVLNGNISLGLIEPPFDGQGSSQRHWWSKTAVYVHQNDDQSKAIQPQMRRGIIVVVHVSVKEFGLSYAKEHTPQSYENIRIPKHLRGIIAEISRYHYEAKELPDRAALVASDGGIWRMALKRRFNDLGEDELRLTISHESAPERQNSEGKLSAGGELPASR